MKTTSYYPVLMTDDVAATASFYITHFRFTPLFEADWYVHLQSSEDKRVNLGIVRGDHETIPPEGRGKASGLLINFEVEDKQGKIDQLAGRYSDGAIDWLDGITVQYDDWWFNVRPSNTEPFLRLVLEAKTPTQLADKRAELESVLGHPVDH